MIEGPHVDSYKKYEQPRSVYCYSHCKATAFFVLWQFILSRLIILM